MIKEATGFPCRIAEFILDEFEELDKVKPRRVQGSS
jgi:hypothetical protein